MLQALNEKQIAAIETPGHVLVTACPGSGKTRVLTYKILRELSNVQDRKKIIIAVTFTNRAADEIKKRLGNLNIETDQVWAGTIHSFCLEWILRPYAGYLQELRDGFTITDRSHEILDTLKQERGLGFFDEVSTRLDRVGNFIDHNHLELLDEYHSILRHDKLIDFNQVLYLSYKVLEENPKICKTLNNLYHIICVDEYQDTQELQYAILSKIICATNGKTLLFMVGDKDQAIYGSLGGIAKTLDEIRDEFEGIFIQERILEGNYRSTQRIIEYYSSFGSDGLDIKSFCDYSNLKGTISLLRTPVDQLNITISKLIQKRLDSGIAEGDICVLAPQWWLITPMARRLKNLLPTVNFDATGLSPLPYNSENVWFKLARLFLVPPSPKMYYVRRRWAAELLRELDAIGVIIFPDSDRRLKQLLTLSHSIKSDSDDGLTYLSDCFSQFLNLNKLTLANNVFLEERWHSFFEGAKRRLANPDFDQSHSIYHFKKMFMNHSGIVVNTCFGIKGEEFDTVIVFGLLDNIVPNWREINDPIIAKKLLYVLCSRAKKHLYLIAEKDRLRRNLQEYIPSVFLREKEYEYDHYQD